MALLQQDGFDHYGNTNLNSPSLPGTIQWVSSGYATPGTTIQTSTAYGKNTGSLGLGLTATTSDVIWLKKAVRPESYNKGQTFTPNKLLVVGFAARFPIALTGRLQFLRIGGQTVSLGTDWFIYVNDVQTSYQCELNIWNFIEVVFDLQTNKFQLYMTDVLAYEKEITAPTFDSVEIRAQYTAGSGSQIVLHADDLYMLDGNPVSYTNGSASNNIERIGKCNTLTRYPTADAGVQMVPLSGANNFSMVNQATPDGDTTYVSSNTPNATDFYKNTTAFETVDDAAIRAVTIAPSARLLEPDSLVVTAVIKVDTSEAVGYRMQMKAATYTSEKHIFEVSPKTGQPFNPAEVLNMSFGHRLLAKAT